MTDDTHGQTPHDPESEEQYAHDAPPAEKETWHGGAPDDDFGDDAAAGEAASVSEESEQAAEADNTIEVVKKRNIFLPAVAAAGGVLLLGVLAYWQFGDSLHGDQQPSPMVVTMPTKSKPSLADVTASTTASLPAEGTSPKTDMAPVVSPDSTPAAVPAPTPAPVASAPASIANSELPPTAAVVVVPTPVKTDNSATEARLAALSSHVEALQKSLDQATQQLSQITNKLATSSSIEDRLNGIEQKLMQVQHAAPAPETQAAGSTPEVTAGENIMVNAMPTTHPALHKTTHHKTVKTASSHSTKESVKAHWVLRAASPTEAWVAKDASTSDLKPVHIGDTLSGIGRVTAIREDNGVWVVDGVKGTIR